MTTDRAMLNHLRHELHTPLNHIIGYSEMLLESAAEGSTAVLEPRLHELHDYAQQLMRLVDEALGRTRKDSEIDLPRLGSEAAAPINSIIVATSQLKTQAQQLGAADVGQDLDRISSAGARTHDVQDQVCQPRGPNRPGDRRRVRHWCGYRAGFRPQRRPRGTD